MIEPLNKKYVKMVAKIVYEGLSLRNLTDHALQYKSRYHGREGFKFRNDHNLANDIVKSVLKNPQSSKIAVAGYEMKADGRVRYVAYAYSPAMSDAGVAKIITADTQYPPTKFLQPQILTTYRERLTSDIKQMLDEVMPIYYIMEGKTDDEYRAEQEMLQDIQVDVPNMEKLNGKYFEFRSKRNKIDKSIARLFDAAEGNYLDVPYESMKDLVLSRSKMNKTLDKIHQMIRRIKPNFKEPEVVVNTIPSDEYESLVKEYIEVGAKQYDKMFAEYMTPEDVEEVNATFKSLDEKLATSVPAQTEGVARMESMEAQYKAFIESVCGEFGCTDAIHPLQEGFDALCESMTTGNQELVRYFRNLDIAGGKNDEPKGFRDEETFWDPKPHFDRWIVHNSQAADRIYEEGFQRGMRIGKLANSWGSYSSNPMEKISGSVAFGTPLEDAKPLDEDFLWGSDWIDCGGSIVCKVSGVTAYHRDDKDNQVMFDIKSPEGCFWIRNTGFKSRYIDPFHIEHDSDDTGIPDSYEVIGKNPDRPLCKGTYERCIQWCRDNGDAYAHMMKRWK